MLLSWTSRRKLQYQQTLGVDMTSLVLLSHSCLGCRAGSAEADPASAAAAAAAEAEAGMREVTALADATPIGTDVLAHIQSRLRPVELYAVRFLEEVRALFAACSATARHRQAAAAAAAAEAEAGMCEVTALADATPIGTDVLAHIQSCLWPVELCAMRFWEEVRCTLVSLALQLHHTTPSLEAQCTTMRVQPGTAAATASQSRSPREILCQAPTSWSTTS